MTKISKKSAYPVKTPVPKDYFVGTDSENNGKTVNFGFEETAYLINKLNGSLIVNYLFKVDNNINLEVLTEGVFLSENNETEVSSITKLYINKKNFAGDDLSELFTFLKSNKNSFFFKLQNSEDLKNACYFNIANVVDHTDYFIFSIDVFIQNIALQSLVHFNVYFFSFDIKSASGQSNSDKFTNVGTISLIDNEITLSTGFDWEINEEEYANIASYSETIPFSSTGMQRFVLFVANVFNTFEIISGPESISNPAVPPTPANTLQTTLVLVTDNSISEPVLPDLSAYATINYVDSHSSRTDNPHNVTKAQIGLSNAENTSDANKPVSTAQAAADATTLASANSYTDSQITQIIDSKVNITDVYNALDCIVAGKVLDARQGKVLNDLIANLTALLNNKLDKGTYPGNAGDLKTDIDNIYQPDVLISSVLPTRSVNTFTYPANQYQALISKTIRTNPAQFVTTISPATTDYKRTDLVYFKSDNTLAKLIGTESLTVAVRPDVPANSVAVSFINVFGAVIDNPTPVTQELSFQDVFGTEIFKGNYVRFNGVSFNAGQKLISIDPLVPLSAFLDVVNGNDTTAVLGNSNKPFKTMIGLINSLPTYSGETYTIYMTGGTVDITRVMPCRNLRFVAFTNTILDFTNVKKADGVTNDTFVFAPDGGTFYWTFENENISIYNTFVGAKQFASPFGNYLGMSSTIQPNILGKLNELKWSATHTFIAAFCYGASSDFSIKLVYSSSILFGGIQNLNSFMRIKELRFSSAVRIFERWGTVTIDNVTETTGSSKNCTITPSPLGIVNVGNITTTGTMNIGGLFVNITGTIAATVTIDITGVTNLTGKISSNTYITGNLGYGNLLVYNFTGRIANILAQYGAVLTIENSSIDTTTLISRDPSGGPASTNASCLTFKGNNVVTQASTAVDLVAGTVAKPIIVTIRGSISTNALSFGKNTSYQQLSATFKEKINEVVVRSKYDIINRVLSSSITYIIDGALTLLTGEYIEVPAGGLTITGYGFNASSISKNISGQSIFISPAGNSGDFISKDISYYPGFGTVFNLTDATGSHAIELNDINFQGVTGSALGVFNGYRQFTGTTCGFYGLSDGLTLEGNWSGFKLTNSNIIGFGASGTLFKKGASTIFNNRLYIDLNIQVATGSKICDFAPANFTNDKSLQVVNCYAKVNGVIDPTTTASTFPNITETSSKAYFVNNIGVKNSNITPYGMSTANMLTYADDTVAAAGGIVQVGETYIESSTGYFKTRLV